MSINRGMDKEDAVYYVNIIGKENTNKDFITVIIINNNSQWSFIWKASLIEISLNEREQFVSTSEYWRLD